MDRYRVFQLDERGCFARFVDFEAASDEDAMPLGARLVRSSPGEVWRGAQRLGRIGEREPVHVAPHRD